MVMMVMMVMVTDGWPFRLLMASHFGTDGDTDGDTDSDDDDSDAPFRAPLVQGLPAHSPGPGSTGRNDDPHYGPAAYAQSCTMI